MERKGAVARLQTNTKLPENTHSSPHASQLISSHQAEQMFKEPKIHQSTSPANMRINILEALVVLLAGLQLVASAMNLPDGIENMLGFVPRSSFQCERDGYFGDIDNDCKIFHLCQRQQNANGRTEWRHWTYACGNQTMFNQLTLTCAFVDEAIPCKHASQFQYLNEVIHKPAEPFLTDADVTSGISYYSNRIMSDGARARAFEDSRLMAQIGSMTSAANSPFATTNELSPALPVAPDQASVLGTNADTYLIEPVENNVFAGLERETTAQKPTAAYPGLQSDLFQRRAQQPVSEVSWPQASNQAASHQQAPSQQQAPSSFDFAIATDHRQFQSGFGPSSTLFLQQQFGQPQSNFRPVLSELAPAPPRPMSVTEPRARLTESATVLPAPLSTTATPTPTTTRSLRPLPTSVPPSTGRATSTTSRPLPTTIGLVTSLRPTLRDPTQPTTTVATMNVTRSQQQVVRPGERLSGTVFHSTRLANKQTRQQQPGVIMRRTTSTSTQQPPLPVAGGTSGARALWQRAFDSQLLAPRFESLITRRRV